MKEEVAMTVDTTVPNGDAGTFVAVSATKVLVISEEGGMLEKLIEMQYDLNIKYFQRLPDEAPYIASEGDVIERIASWRPYIGWAEIIIVDDPSYVARLGSDFNLKGKLVLYRVNDKVREEADRLIHWMNPLTLATLKDAMENVDIEASFSERKVSWWKRLFRSSHA